MKKMIGSKLTLGVMLAALLFTLSCNQRGGPGSGPGKTTPMKALSPTYETYKSDVKDGMQGVDLKALPATQQELALKILNEVPCSCGCRKTSVAECRVRVTDCDIGRQQADYIIDQVKGGAQEGEVVRSLYGFILGQQMKSVLSAISPKYSKTEMVTALARLMGIDASSFKKTGNEMVDARAVAKAFLGDNAGLLKYLEGLTDELYIMHGVTFELLQESQRPIFEFFYFQNQPKLQESLFPYFNPGVSEANMIIGMSEDLMREPDPRSGVKIEIGSSPSRGPEDAPITVVEFCDFQCPFCAKAQPTAEQFWNKYPGKVRYVFKNFPLMSIHPGAEPAARAGLAAAKQGKFWEFHKLLYENQRNLNQATFEQLAQQLGMNVEKFKADMESQEIKDAVQTDLKYAVSLGVRSTPTFFVNGTEISGARSICSFVEAAEATH